MTETDKSADTVVPLPRRPDALERPLAALLASDRAALMVQYRRLRRELLAMLALMGNAGILMDQTRDRSEKATEALVEVILQSPDQ